MPTPRLMMLLPVLLSCVAAVATVPGTALGQAHGSGKAADQPKDRARAIANRAFELFQRGRYEEANDLFQQADAAFHAPTLVLMVARSYAKLGRLADAAAAYEQTANEALGPGASQEFRRAQQAARDELAAIEPDVPHLVLTFRESRDAARAQVSVDGTAVPPERTTKPIAVNPGEHRVEVTAPDSQPVTLNRTFKVGQVERIEIAPLAPLEPTGPTGPPPPPPEGEGSVGLLIGGSVALVLGVGGLVMGTATGVVALNKKSALEESCPTKWCSPDDQPLADAAKTNATLSTVGFVVGGVAVAVGVTLLAVELSSTPSAEQPAEAATPTILSLGLGPAAFELRGTF